MSSPTREPPAKDNLEVLMKNITKPKLLSSFNQIDLTVNYGERSFELNMFNFNTVSDLKLAIYNHYKEDYAAPNNQFIYIKIGPLIQPIDFSWVDKSLLQDPLNTASRNDINYFFVSADGLQNNIKTNNYNDVLLEHKIKEATVYLTFFKDVYSAIPGPKPLSDKQYYGIIYQYFPYLKKDIVYPNDNEETNLQNILTHYNKKIECIYKINQLLEEGGYEFVVPVCTGLRYLRLVWLENDLEENIDSYFYTLDVNDIRPYVRLLPVGTSPISKVHLKDGENNIPNISNVSYLSDWTDEKNPTPDRDFIYGKIALKSTIMNLPFIYSTIRILDDGSFDATIEPPNKIRNININSDFENMTEDLLSGISDINKSNSVPSIGTANLTYSLSLPSSSQISRKQFENRIQIFKPIFQKIAPLPNEQPFYMLRYRLVDNYVTEDNISNYITQLSNKKLLRGEIKPEDIVTLLAEEFQLDNDSALKHVQKWYRKKDELQQINIGETKNYAPLNNTGVDIAIFQTKNLYTFHIYNIDSIKTLQRILTCLAFIFIAPEEDLLINKKDVRIFQQKEEQEQDAQSLKNAETEEDLESLSGLNADILFGMTEDAESEPSENISEIRKQLQENAEESRSISPTIAQEDLDEDKGTANFFIRKLKEVDRSLFDYVVKEPTEKRTRDGTYKKVKEKSYVQGCAANEMRQPAALTQTQYESMIEEYEHDDIQFQLYPLGEIIDKKGRRVKDKDIVDQRSDPDKIITVLRYGSNPLKENYYVCSEYFCIRDEIILLKKDFLGTHLRHPKTLSDGTILERKPAKSCPFCMGTIMSSRRKPGINETVIQRVYKPETINKKHLWIGFLKKSSPTGMKLPCCFLVPKKIEFKDVASGFVKKDEDEDEDEELVETIETGIPIFDYNVTLSRIQKKYIVGEVLPLEVGERDGPQIGLLPGPLNKIFQQDPVNIVGRIGNIQKILPDAKGFLRIGVENRKRYIGDSFLAAIAPFFSKNSAQQMKERILEVITPRIYIHLNYGNLLLEFYSPSDPVLQKGLLQRWANNNLGVTYNDTNKLEIERIYKSYNAFTNWLMSDEKKEYRQFAMLLAQTNLIQGTNRPGITFIVVDLNADSTVSIRCPSYGYNTELMTNNDIAFLFHHHTGIWEPIFYVDNVVTSIQITEPYNLIFQKARYDAWPSVVKTLLSEFINKCAGPGKTVFTPQSYIKSNTTIPLSYAKNVIQSITQKYSNFFFVGILRDSYNHIAGIVCEEKRSERNYQVILPVIDDGILITTKDIYLNYNDLDLESYDNTMRIYNKYIFPYFVRYGGYKPVYVAKNSETQMYIAIQLANNLFIPFEETKTIKTDLKVIEIDEFEWDIDRTITFENEEESKEIYEKIMKENDINEIYEHLRITFGNYLANKGGSIIYYLETDIIFNNDLTLNDKRGRMIKLLGPLLLSWLSTDSQEKTQSLLRKDCLIQTESTCTGNCVWTTNNKCKIHVEHKYMNVNMANLLMLRLFDEILRYSEKRKQLFNNEISRLVFLNEAIRIGNQYIVPENTLEWSELLRSMWADRKSEAARFFEEFSEQLVEKDEEDIYHEIPAEVSEILGDTLKYHTLTDDRSLSPILSYMGLNDIDIKYDGKTPTFTIKQLIDIGTSLKAYIVQLDARVIPVDIKRISTISNRKPIIVVLITPSGSGIIVKNGNEKIAFEDISL